ncbi:MAG TPA: glycosyltransferase family 2 protein [Steroidobacteraceae bacterium]|nr:glycosyltransferase family 2 protein [Steroidobacteraceae bacterium]
MTSISVVTVCFNSAKSIGATLRSVAGQSHTDREHIIVDGGSSDETMAIVRAQGGTRSLSEPDRGIYDAMNKGVGLASGELIGFLNSDDCYSDSGVLADVASAHATTGADFVYGDLDMIGGDGVLVRRWRTGAIPARGLRGRQIPHPVLWVRRELLLRLSPPFDPSYRISADLKQQLLLINKMGARGTYVRRPLARMGMGGASTSALSSYLTGWRESARAYNEVFGGGGWWFTTRKVSSKLPGLRWGRVAPNSTVAP